MKEPKKTFAMEKEWIKPRILMLVLILLCSLYVVTASAVQQKPMSLPEKTITDEILESDEEREERGVIELDKEQDYRNYDTLSGSFLASFNEPNQKDEECETE
jgi:hypothetical protein